jgi:hypothetical protein
MLLPLLPILPLSAGWRAFCLVWSAPPPIKTLRRASPAPPSQGYLRARLLPDTPVPLQSLSRVSSGDPEENSVSHRHTCGHRGHVSCSLRKLSEVVGRGRERSYRAIRTVMVGGKNRRRTRAGWGAEREL